MKIKKTDVHPHPASFKDPSGFLFTADGVLYRQVNPSYAHHYDTLKNSGLYVFLTGKKWLIEHEEVSDALFQIPEAYKILRPERLPLVTYPYEWCFSQLQEAGLITIEIMRAAMDHGMILKDASAYNIQFRNGLPLLIDTLSFEIYDPLLPWKAYRQFCQHFLYPLLLEHYLGNGSIAWLRNYLDGMPASVAAPLLPFKSRWNVSVMLHLFLQQKVSGNSKGNEQPVKFSRKKMHLLLDDLQRLIQSLRPGYPARTEWSDYYQNTILSDQYLQAKERLIAEWLSPHKNCRVIDAGANDGHFSILAESMGQEVIAIENDPLCIEHLHKRIVGESIKGVHTVIADFSNPSPPLGFAHRERSSLTDRCSGDILMALALVHHLVIGRSIPMPRLAAYFSLLAPCLILEFIPKEDEKVKTMLQSREDVFTDYDQEHLESYFETYYSIRKKTTVGDTKRILYWMERKPETVI